MGFIFRMLTNLRKDLNVRNQACVVMSRKGFSVNSIKLTLQDL